MQITLDQPTTNDSFVTYFTDNLSLQAAICGPIDVSKTRFEYPTKPHFEINIIPASGVSSTQESAIASQLSRILNEVVELHTYASKQFTITVQIVDQTKDQWQTQIVDIVNGVYLACLTAGVKLQSSFWGAKVFLNRKGEFVESSNDESITSVHRAIWGVKNGVLDQLVFLDSNGEFDQDNVWKVLDQSGKIVENEIDQVRDIVKEHVASQFVFK